MKLPNPMKKLTILLFSFLLISTAFAGPGSKFDKIVFFGDSLSDNGNLAYWTSFVYQIPQAPAYKDGRFSNGPVWSEYFAKYFIDQNVKIQSTNYAYGGESIILHNPFKGYLPYAITASYYSYLANTLFSSRDTTLFVIFIGANDYLNGVKPEKDGTETTTNTDYLKSIIDGLIYHGGKNFLIISLPDLSKTPMAIENKRTANLEKVSVLHDAKLAKIIDELANEYKQANIQLFNFNPIFTDMVQHIDKYNKKYGINITNTTQACWGGGYTNYRLQAGLGAEPLTKEKVLSIILSHQKEAAKRGLKMVNPRTDKPDAIEVKEPTPEEIADAVIQVPTIREAFTIGELSAKGMKPCTDADNHMFWDHVHPTRVIHKIIAKEVIQFVNEHFEHI